MVKVDVRCPDCNKNDVSKYGKQPNGAQKYSCKSEDCSRTTFLLKYKKKGFIKSVRAQVVDMAINGSGVRDTGRVLGISKDTVISILKKKNLILCM